MLPFLQTILNTSFTRHRQYRLKFGCCCLSLSKLPPKNIPGHFPSHLNQSSSSWHRDRDFCGAAFCSCMQLMLYSNIWSSIRCFNHSVSNTNFTNFMELTTSSLLLTDTTETFNSHFSHLLPYHLRTNA